MWGTAGYSRLQQRRRLGRGRFLVTGAMIAGVVAIAPLGAASASARSVSPMLSHGHSSAPPTSHPAPPPSVPATTPPTTTGPRSHLRGH